jgi:hypothetical protein
MSLYVHLTDVTIIDVTTVHGIVAVFPFVNPDVLIEILTSGPETILYTIYVYKRKNSNYTMYSCDVNDGNVS